MRGKRVFAVGIVSLTLVIGFVVVGCAGTPTGNDIGVYDSSIAEDQLCTLEIAGGLKVVGFNDQKVSWAINGSPDEGPLALIIQGDSWKVQKGGSKYKTTIKIPSGSHNLRVDIYLWDYNKHPGFESYYIGGGGPNYLRGSGLEISYDFLPGHTYFLRPVFNNKVFGKEVEVVDYEGGGFGIVLKSVNLRIDEDGKVVVSGPSIPVTTEFK